MNELVAQYARAADLRPETAHDVYSDLGVELSSIGERRAAVAAYQRALSIAPMHAVAYNNLAALLASAGRRPEALQLYLIAYSLEPSRFAEHPQMHLNVASQLVDAARYDEAIWHYQRGLAYAPLAEDTLGRLAHLHQRVCDWHGVDRVLPALQRAVVRLVDGSHEPHGPHERPPISPMHLMTLPFGAHQLLQLARAHAGAIARETSDGRVTVFTRARPPLPLLQRSGDVMGGSDAAAGRLRIGLVSGDFKRHPVSILLAPVLGQVRSPSARPPAVAMMAVWHLTWRRHGSGVRACGAPSSQLHASLTSSRSLWRRCAQLRRLQPRLHLTLFALNPDAGDEWRRMLREAADAEIDLSAEDDARAAQFVHDAQARRRASLVRCSRRRVAQQTLRIDNRLERAPPCARRTAVLRVQLEPCRTAGLRRAVRRASRRIAPSNVAPLVSLQVHILLDLNGGWPGR